MEYKRDNSVEQGKSWSFIRPFVNKIKDFGAWGLGIGLVAGATMMLGLSILSYGEALHQGFANYIVASTVGVGGVIIGAFAKWLLERPGQR